MMPTDDAAAVSSFLQLVRRRTSCRRYDAARPVNRRLLVECIEAARLAPSACNAQPWRFIIADDPDICGRLREAARMPGIPHPWWDDVPVFVVLAIKRKILTHRVAPAVSGIDYPLIDAGIAGEHVVLAAAERGLGTCWIGWFKPKAVKTILNLPKPLSPVALITVGYPAAADDMDSTQPQHRLPLEDILQWNDGRSRGPATGEPPGRD